MPGRFEEGVYWPSVTEVIPPSLKPDLSWVPADVLEQARIRGTALHRAVDLHERGVLDESTVHPVIRPGFDAYLDFKRATLFRYERGEFELRSRRWRYVGHPDLLGWFGADRALLDIKYVASFSARYQLYTAIQAIGGYGLAWREEHPQEPIRKFYALWLTLDGESRVIELVKPNAETVFQAALVIAREARALEGDPNAGSSSDRAAA